MKSNKNIFEEFISSLENDKIVSIAGAAGSGKSFLTFFICEYFLLKNKKILVIDTIADMVIAERISQSNNVKYKIDNFKYVTLDDADSILKLVSQLKDMVIVLENLNSIQITKKFCDGSDLNYDRATTLSKLYRKLRVIANDNNLNIITTNMTYRSYAQNGNQSDIIYGGNAVSYISDTIIGCEKDIKDNTKITLKVIKSRSGAHLNGESIFNIENMIKCYVRKQKIKKILSI